MGRIGAVKISTKATAVDRYNATKIDRRPCMVESMKQMTIKNGRKKVGGYPLQVPLQDPASHQSFLL
jgi:hypothetical protein